MASACERRKAGQLSEARAGAGSGVLEDLPDRGRSDPHAQHQQLAVDAPVPPRAVLAGQAEHQRADRPDRGWPPGALGPRDASVTSRDQVAVPAAHGFWADGQADPAQHVAREPVEHSREEGAIGRGEPHLRTLQLSLEDRDLVAQGEDLGLFGLVTHRQEPQHRERVGHAEVRQSQ